MKVALYIPCYNSEKTISACLDGVLSQVYPLDEILIIDDGSVDKTAEILSKYPVRIIRHAKNMGLAAARNSALSNIKSELVASLDSDCRPDKNWLKHLVNSMRSLKTAGSGGKVIEAKTSGMFNAWRSVHMKQHWGERKKNNPDFLFGSNTLFHREALLKAGAYRKAYRNNYEDVDISYRLKKLGYSLAYEPKAVAYHLRDDDIQSLLNNFWRWNFNYYLKKGSYATPARFIFKVKDNIGMANRFLEEDLRKKRYKLIYLDFLIFLHHNLRDFDYFSSRSRQVDSSLLKYSKASIWLSFLDLAFFYHYDHDKKNLSTFLPGKSVFQHNFFALNLVLRDFIHKRFKSSKFRKLLFKHLITSVYRINDNLLMEKLYNLTELHQDWSGLFKKRHFNLNAKFLKVMLYDLERWMQNLEKRFPGLIKLIENSAKDN